MPKDSERLRDKAAHELRESRRKPTSTVDRAQHTTRAASYKALAESEEWLAGDKRRSKVRPPRPKT
ncbi:MAG: hypothetical protein K2Y27_15920 [Xanthobacteraceae bacterium]|nr:hypothetical protein [Xanthobacteraceae bacterium]